MSDAPTIVTQLKRTPLPVTTTGAVATRFRLRPARRFTAAHVALERHPTLDAELGGALDRLSLELGQLFDTRVGCTARLLDATLEPLSSCGQRSVFALFELTQAGAMGVLELDAALVALLLQHAAGTTEPAPVASTLTRIEEAALGWVLLSSLAALRRGGDVEAKFAPRLGAVLFDRAHAAQRLAPRTPQLIVEVIVSAGPCSGTARLVLPVGAVLAALSPAVRPAPAKVGGRLASATVPARCIAGLVLLERADAASLVERDVVLFPLLRRTGDTLAGRTRLVTPSFELRGETSSQGFTLTRALTHGPLKEHAMSDLDTSLPVELELELARVRIPVSELASMQPGHLLALKLDPFEPVTLRVGDQAFARAELVEIDGTVGARILELL